MTVEQKDKIFTAVEESTKIYSKECEKRIAEENGKIIGAYYMANRIYDIIRIEFEAQTSGRWLETDEGFSPYQCSKCNSIEFKKSIFCPNCGAKMQESENEQ